MIYLPIDIKSKTALIQRGRPRAFDLDAALERAMHVFWAKGYEGAALSDLTRAMRINRPSLYAAFGNKEQLFRKVLDRYASGPLAYFEKALEAPGARDVIEQILFGAAKVRWLAEIRLGLFRRKSPRAALPAKLPCVVAFSEQREKGIYSETPTRPNWPVT